MSADAVKPTLWNNDWDGSGMIIDDYLFEGGENSQFHIVKLNRGYDAAGKVTVDPQLVFNAPGWDDELLAAIGDKDVSIAIKAKGSAEDGGIWQRLKHEGGVHRVQRVPVTESQGRIHTSAAGVLVYPEAEDVDVEGILKGLHRVSVAEGEGPRVQLMASGVGFPWVKEAARLLAEEWGVQADLWSVTSWNELARDGAAADEQGLLDEAAAHVARFKLPKAFVFVDEVIRSPAGKADYRWAKERALSA